MNIKRDWVKNAALFNLFHVWQQKDWMKNITLCNLFFDSCMATKVHDKKNELRSVRDERQSRNVILREFNVFCLKLFHKCWLGRNRTNIRARSCQLKNSRYMRPYNWRCKIWLISWIIISVTSAKIFCDHVWIHIISCMDVWIHIIYVKYFST